MKSYEEMAKCVLERRDQELAEKKKRIKMIRRYSSLAACMGLAVVLGYKVFDKMNNIPRSDFIKNTQDNTSSAETSANTETTVIKTENAVTKIYVQYTDGNNTTISAAAETKTTVTSAVSKTKPAVTSVKNSSTAAETATSPVSKTTKHTTVKTTKATAVTSHAPAVTSTAVHITEPTSPSTEDPKNENVTINDDIVRENFQQFSYNGKQYSLSILESAIETVPVCPPDKVGDKVADIALNGSDNSLTLSASVYLINDCSEDIALAVWFQGGQKYYTFTS